MKKQLMITSVYCLLLAACGNNKQEGNASQTPTYQSKHSALFNSGVDSLLLQYEALAQAFVNWQADSLSPRAKAVFDKLQNLPLTQEDLMEVRKDSAAFLQLNQDWTKAKSAAMEMVSGADIETKRQSFNRLTNHMFAVLRSLQYDNSKLYLQKCPMAFNDTGTGVWISRVAAINNPYLGKQHPRYKAGMLHCGETLEELDVAAAANGKKD